MGAYKIIATSLMAHNPRLGNKQRMSAHKRLCIVCQIDKPQKGSRIKQIGNLAFFMCAECAAKRPTMGAR